jgi:hypothetical protein
MSIWTNKNGIILPSSTTNNVYQEKRNKYKLDHTYCPKCGSDEIEIRGVGGLVIDYDTFKDQNKATCYTCKFVGIAHDLVDVNKAEEIKQGTLE